MKKPTFIKYGIAFVLLFVSYFIKAQDVKIYPPNGDFNFLRNILIVGVPNHITADNWSRVNPNTTPDITSIGCTNYGYSISPEYNSNNGGYWLRCIDLPNYFGMKWREGVSTVVSGLIPGKQYMIKFEQSIVAAKIHLEGRWRISLGGETLDGPWITPPSTEFSMKPWENVCVGPFLAISESMILKVEAEAKNQAVQGDWDGCDLALDGIFLEEIGNHTPVVQPGQVPICKNPPSELLVYKVVASDIDNDNLNFFIVEGNEEGIFEIDSLLGEITLKNKEKLEASSQDTFNLKIKAFDSFKAFGEAVITITIHSPGFDVQKTASSCHSLGKILVKIFNNDASIFTYSLNGGINFQGSNAFDNLKSGNYHLVVKDTNHCSDSKIVTIDSMHTFSIDSIEVTHSTCTTDGSILINTSTQTTFLKYSIDGGVTYQLNNNFNGLKKGILYVEILDTNSCNQRDTIEIDLLVNLLNIKVINLGNRLEAEMVGASYQWLDCNKSFQPLNGQTNKILQVSSKGDYAVELTLNECVDTSDCMNVNILDIEDAQINREQPFVYRSQTNNDLILYLGASLGNSEIRILDLTGHLIKSMVFNNKNEIPLNFEGKTGIYFVEIVSGSRKIKTIKFQK